MRCAAIDIGTNSCRLLVADVQNNILTPLCRTLQTTRLGEGINSSGIINDLTAERTIKCLNCYSEKMQAMEVSAFRTVATSAVREADNRSDFVELVNRRCHMELEVIDGEKEAHLSYSGVKLGLNLDTPPLVIDLGGGSTEFICLTQSDKFIMSLPLGAVRATEAKISAYDMAQILTPLAENKDQFAANPLVFVGGTATTLVAIKLALEEYKSHLVHGQVLTRREIADIYNMLERMPLPLRRRLPGLQPERADIIPQGVLEVLLIMDTLNREELTVSESDILDGVIWELAGSPSD